MFETLDIVVDLLVGKWMVPSMVVAVGTVAGERFRDLSHFSVDGRQREQILVRADAIWGFRHRENLIEKMARPSVAGSRRSDIPIVEWPFSNHCFFQIAIRKVLDFFRQHRSGPATLGINYPNGPVYFDHFMIDKFRHYSGDRVREEKIIGVQKADNIAMAC